VWVGSVGLFQWMGRGLIMRHDPTTGLPAEVVWSVGRDRGGGLWLGTGKCLARAGNGRWDCLPASAGWSVRTFVFPPQGGIFLAGGPPDLLYVDPAGQPTRLELAGERVADRHIMAMTIGTEGDLWLATTTGLYRLPGALPGRPERVTVPGTRPDTRYISIVLIDGRLWTAGDAGLAVLERGRWQLLDRRSQIAGGGDPDGSADGAGGRAPRGVDRRSQIAGGGDPDGSADGAGGRAPVGSIAPPGSAPRRCAT